MTYPYKVACVFLLGFFIDCVNIFMSAMALPDIAQTMHLTPSDTTWVSNAYILGLSLIMPLSAWLSTRLGSKNLLTLSMLIFASASLFCGMSQSFPSLLFWRFIQGLGGGLMIPVGQALVFTAFPVAKRSKISTLIMAVALLAPALSPSLGGMLIDHANWSWIFWVHVPLALLAAFLAFLWLEKTPPTTTTAPDLRGLSLVSLALLSLLLALTQLGPSPKANSNTWLTLLPYGALLMAVLCSLLYVRHAKHHVDAILDLRLFKSSKLWVCVLVYHAVPGLFTGINLLAIFYLQTVVHFSATHTGQLMLFYAAGAFIAMVLGGRFYPKIGAKKLLLIGISIHALGMFSLLLTLPSHSFLLMLLSYVLMGVGGGLSANTAQTTALLDFTGHELLKGSVLWNINRQIALSVGVALATLLLSLNQQLTTLPMAYVYSFAILALLCALVMVVLPKLSASISPVSNTFKD